jgi:hypothetical protein
MGIDFTLFYSCTHAAMHGKDFYDVNNLIFYDWEESLMVFPGLLLFYIPFMLLDVKVAHFVYYLLSLGASMFSYILLFKITGQLKNISFRKPDLNTFVFLAGIFVFFNSSPQLMCQRNGQAGTWVWLLLLLFFFVKNKYLKSVFFGIATVFKYSIMTFFAPLLFLKKQYFTCIAAFIVFLLIGCWPVLAGYNIFELYARYAEVIINTLSGGCNSYELAGQDLLQFGFFRFQPLNVAGKAFFLCFMIYAALKERNKEGIGLNLLLLTFSLTMLISYHRLYDNIILVMLLILKTNFLVQTKNWKNVIMCCCFLGFYLIPISYIFQISSFLGSNIPVLKEVFYLSDYSTYPSILPVVAFSQIAIGIYTIFLYLKTEDNYIFKLK